MRILYLANNWVGWEILRWLKEQREDVVGLVIHPPERQKYGKELLAESGLDDERVFYGHELKNIATLDAIRALEPDMGISIFFGYILKGDLLSLLPQGCINLHPAYLPFNRGHYPNVWSIVEGTPSGVTLHHIDLGVDTGDIISQRPVRVEAIDTGETLYRRLEKTCVELFREAWPSIKAGQASRVSQAAQEGTYHRTRDVERIDRIDLERQYAAKDLINIIRARTFPPYPGAYYEQDGRRVYLRLQLTYEEESEVAGERGTHE